jgi:hypothetical protein
MQIHFLPVLVCAVVSMIIGMIWYGPMLFGKTWARLIKADPDCMNDPVKRKEANKKAMPLYAIQFVLAIFQIWVLAHFIQGWVDTSALEVSLWIWAAFIMPMAAGGSMWSGDSRKDAWQKFFITAGFNLVLFIVFALILSHWR